jgi:hypothetical protein
MYRPQQQSTDRCRRLGFFYGSEKAAHHTSSTGLWLLMAVIVVDVLRLSQTSHTARWFFAGGYWMKKRLSIWSAVVMATLLAAQSASAASAPPLTEVKILKVESPQCGFETLDQGQTQTRCNHSGPNIRVYVLEVGYGRSQPHAALDGFEVNGTRSPVCAYENGNLTDCSQRTKIVGNLYIFSLAGKQEGTFTFSNTSINAPRNTMSTQLYIK